MAKTDWTMNDTVMPEDMNELGAEVNAKVNHSLADATYYVNASTGSDTNDGLSAEKALKTIGAAIAKVPQVLNHGYIINVASGTYMEDIQVRGLSGSGTLDIMGDNTTPTNVKVSSFSYFQCTCGLSLQGMQLTRTSDAGLHAERVLDIYIPNIICTDSSIHPGVRCYMSTVRLINPIISNRGYAIDANYGANVQIQNGSGTGNTFGMSALNGATVSIAGTGPNGIIQYNTYYGGRIGIGNISVTSSNINLYVSPSGNDSNDGSSGAPLKTIQAAINRIPQVVNHTVTINVAPGTYAEDVKIHGFQGSGGIELIGNYADPSTVVVNSINGNHSRYLIIKGITATRTNSPGFWFVRSDTVIVDGVRCVTASATESGFHADGTIVRLYNSTFSNRKYGISCGYCGTVHSHNNNGTGNTIGLFAYESSAIGKNLIQPGGTTAESVESGGVIR